MNLYFIVYFMAVYINIIEVTDQMIANNLLKQSTFIIFINIANIIKEIIVMNSLFFILKYIVIY